MVDMSDFWKGFWTGAGVLVAVLLMGRVARVL
jgi:hypothetical protein